MSYKEQAMTYEYKLIIDNGLIAYVKAKSRTEALDKYCEETGVNKSWLKEHCVVRNMGRLR